MPHKATRPPSLPVMIDLTTISTPKQSAIVARTGPIDPAIIQQATDARVRSLPVIDENNRCRGAITVEALAELAAKKQELSPNDATTACDILPHKVPVHELLKLIAANGIALHSADPDEDDYQDDWFGIVSTADLNRPIFRAHIYQMLVILETSLAQLIMDDFGDDWGAIRLLSDHTQSRIKEFYEEERAEGIDLSPVTNATLSDLFHITTESNRIWSLIGYSHPNELRPIAHRINDLRNTIMHPVRPLIVNDKELQDLVTAVHDVENITNKLVKQIGVLAG